MYINDDIHMPIKVKDVSGFPLVPVPGHNCRYFMQETIWGMHLKHGERIDY